MKNKMNFEQPSRKQKKSGKKLILPVAIFVFLLIILSIALNKAGVLDKAISGSSGEDPTADANAVLTSYFIDVGQGDCSLFISGDESMLIDCGESQYSDQVIKEIRDRGVESLDYIVATHAHSDHMGGMADIIKSVPCDHILLSEPCDDSSQTATYENFLDAVEGSSIEPILAESGYTFTLGAAECRVLSPSYVSKDENNNSIVMTITVSDTMFLMMGDAEKQIENSLLDAYPDIHADIIKLGHHGSKTSSSKDFLRAVNPKYSIISVGAGNMYGHPSEETLDTLKELNITPFRTDELGTIRVDCSENGYKISYNDLTLAEE